MNVLSAPILAQCAHHIVTETNLREAIWRHAADESSKFCSFLSCRVQVMFSAPFDLWKHLSNFKLMAVLFPYVIEAGCRSRSLRIQPYPLYNERILKVLFHVHWKMYFGSVRHCTTHCLCKPFQETQTLSAHRLRQSATCLLSVFSSMLASRLLLERHYVLNKSKDFFKKTWAEFLTVTKRSSFDASTRYSAARWHASCSFLEVRAFFNHASVPVSSKHFLPMLQTFLQVLFLVQHILPCAYCILTVETCLELGVRLWNENLHFQVWPVLCSMIVLRVSPWILFF